ncbi:MAG: competence protein ComEC [Flavobacterium sp.]|jgi:competence protein ComEC
MYLPILAFVIASILAANAPTIYINGYYTVVLCLCALIGTRYDSIRTISGGILGFIFCQYLGLQYVHQILPTSLEGKEMLVEGRVLSLPKEGQGHTRFEFELLQSEGNFTAKRIVLNWYFHNAVSAPRPGEEWQFLVKLNRPRGVVNEGLFNVETWLLTRNISAQGYIRESTDNKRLKHPTHHQLHHRLRLVLRELVEARLPPDRERGLIIALIIGDSAGIDKETWEILSKTGTNHLLIISGLHVGFVAGIFFYLFSLKPLRMNRSLVVFFSVLMTICYGLLAGMGLPVQRALVMVIIGLGAVHVRRKVPLVLILLYALLIVTFVNPFSSLSPGYWLSFGAVTSLVFAFSGRPAYVQGLRGKMESALRTQWVIFIMMSPILLYWIHQFSIIGFLVNLVAIPFVALLIVPLLLLATLLLLLDFAFANFLLDFTYYLMQMFVSFLEYFGDLQWVYYQHSVKRMEILLACLGGAILLFPKGLVPKWLVLVLFLPLFLPSSSELKPGDLVLKVLDVGQGLSVLIQTKKHIVVYDTGPIYGNGIDAGTRIVSPAIQTLGRKQIHSLIVSHGDSDHSGGVEGLLEQHLIYQFFAGEPEPSSKVGKVLRCHKGQTWNLDGVNFSFLNDSTSGGVNRNNKSCVLMIKAGAFKALLPGDIELTKEASLLNSALVGVNLLVSPHHGSLTSSSPGFLNQLMPEVVVVSSAYKNKFGHPHRRIIERYENRGARVLNTAESGEILIKFIDGIVQYESERNKHPRFWYQ